MTQQPLYGPHNPHLLAQMRTELVWEGKYDEYGNRREVDIAGCTMPMQKIEGIDEPRREAAANQQLTLFEQQNPRVDDFRNRLVWGDNKLVMASLLQEFNVYNLGHYEANGGNKNACKEPTPNTAASSWNSSAPKSSPIHHRHCCTVAKPEPSAMSMASTLCSPVTKLKPSQRQQQQQADANAIASPGNLKWTCI